jgi:uncharacterized iron-regulated membrane protein
MIRKSDQTPKRGLYRPEIVRAVLSGHSILGIAFAAVIYLLCLTGSLSVFERDFDRWEQPAAPIVTSVSPVAVDRAVTTVLPHIDPDAALYVTMPSPDMPRLTLTGDRKGEDHSWIADAQGRIAADQTAPWTDFLTTLHTELHLPGTWGRFIVGLAGVALLSSLISGTLAHPRIVRDAFHLRLGGSRRLQEADLHNRIGVWALPFHVVVSLTGALLGLSTIIVGTLAILLFGGDTAKVYALLLPPTPKADTRTAPPPDIATILATVSLRAPEAEVKVITIQHAGRRDASVQISAGRPSLLAMQDSFSFDAAGRVVAEKHRGELNLGERILGSLGPLHFGWFGGVAVRIAYGLLGIGLCVVTASGISIWLARRRDKGRPAPHWERVWAAIIWGQPVTLAATATLVTAAPSIGGKAAYLWIAGTLTIILGAAFWRVSAEQLAGMLRKTLGVLLLTTAGIQVLSRGIGLDPVAAAIDAVLLVSGVYLLAWKSRNRHVAPVRPDLSA